MAKGKPPNWAAHLDDGRREALRWWAAYRCVDLDELVVAALEEIADQVIVACFDGEPPVPTPADVTYAVATALTDTVNDDLFAVSVRPVDRTEPVPVGRF